MKIKLPKSCVACEESGLIIPHCGAADPPKVKACRWWLCLACDSYGDLFSERFVDKRTKKQKAA